MPIEILMATYNSEKYLECQIESVLKQNRSDWKLIARDDGSSDGTVKILASYAERYPEKILFYETDKNSGPKENFNALLRLSVSDRVMFSDHDDMWFPDKISVTADAMEKEEKKNGSGMPILVFTDKSVADEFLNVTYESAAKAERFRVNNIVLNRLLMQNVASGCTMMVNRALLDKCGSIPEGAYMHDFWLMLVAECFGRIRYVDKPTMLYRQHGGNSLGSEAYTLKNMIARALRGNKSVKKYIDQGICFLKTYGKELPDGKRKVLEEFARLRDAGPVEYRKIIIKNGFFKTGFIKNAGVMCRF